MNVRFKKLRTLLFVFVLAIAGCDIFQQPVDKTQLLFSSNTQPTQALLDVLKRLEVQHDGTVASIVEQTQKKWLRPAGIERYQMKDAYAQRKDELRPLFRKLGLIDEVAPSLKKYDYVLVHGATILATRARLAYLAKLWRAGIRFKQLIFLTGARTLFPEQEHVGVLCDRTQTVLPIRSDWQWNEAKAPRTEADMMEMVYEQSVLPADLKAVPLLVIDVPQQMKDGQLKRPTTHDTLVQWLKTNPVPGTCLFISNQPFIGYQDAITRAVLPVTFHIETVGFALPVSYESVALCLDSLARWIYVACPKGD